VRPFRRSTPAEGQSSYARSRENSEIDAETQLKSSTFVRAGMYQTSSQRAQKVNTKMEHRTRNFPVCNSFTRSLTNNSHPKMALINGGSLMYKDEGMQVLKDRLAARPNPTSWS
jgi:hypothetical protein